MKKKIVLLRTLAYVLYHERLQAIFVITDILNAFII